MARKMALAPSGAYFVKKLDAVGGISDSDLVSMAFAEISASAPVSPDRLRCGAMRAPDGSATAFGAIESSAFNGLDEETIATADIVMPSFCAFLSSKLGDPFLQAWRRRIFLFKRGFNMRSETPVLRGGRFRRGRIATKSRGSKKSTL